MISQERYGNIIYNKQNLGDVFCTCLERMFEKMHLEKMTCVIFVGDQNLIYGRSPQVVKTKKTRSAVVISFQVVSRRDGSSKVHSRRIWYSIF